MGQSAMACGHDPIARGGSFILDKGENLHLVKAGCSVACLEWRRRMSAKGVMFTSAKVALSALKPYSAKEARH